MKHLNQVYSLLYKTDVEAEIMSHPFSLFQSRTHSRWGRMLLGGWKGCVNKVDPDWAG